MGAKHSAFLTNLHKHSSYSLRVKPAKLYVSCPQGLWACWENKSPYSCTFLGFGPDLTPIFTSVALGVSYLQQFRARADDVTHICNSQSRVQRARVKIKSHKPKEVGFVSPTFSPLS